MRAKPKQVLKSISKTNSHEDRKPQGKNVIVVKHFQPKVIYDSVRYKFNNLPEFYLDVESEENVKKLEKLQSKSRPVSRNLQSHVLHKLQSIFPPNLKSKSLVENKVCSTNTLEFKSKSFDNSSSNKATELKVCGPRPSKLKNSPEKKTSLSNRINVISTNVRPRRKLNPGSSASSIESKKSLNKLSETSLSPKLYRKKVEYNRNTLISSSESERNNSEQIASLKSEILLNKALAETSSKESVSVVNGQSKTREERINALRNEINELIYMNVDRKRSLVLELKSEIAEFRNTGSVPRLNTVDENTEKYSNDTICVVDDDNNVVNDDNDVQMLSTKVSEPKMGTPEFIESKILKESTKENEEKIFTSKYLGKSL